MFGSARSIRNWLEVAGYFTRFYENCAVLKQGLNLLGIETAEHM
jgi:arginyl-tRNA synthetase